MPQINGIQNGPIANNNVEQVQAQPQAGRAANAGRAQGQRINDIVNQVELLPYQQRRAERSTGQQVAYVIGRVVGAVLTLGVSEGIIAIGHKAEARNAEMLREQAVARHAADMQFNRQLGESLKSGVQLAPEYQAAVQEAVGQLRETFGDLVPDDANDIAQLPGSSDVKYALKGALSAEQDLVDPARLRELLLEKATPFIREKAAELALGQAFQAAGHDVDASQNIELLFHTNPGLREELGTCIDRASVDNVIGAWEDRIEAFAAHVKGLADSKKAALEHAVATMAEACGVSVEDMGRHLNLGKLKMRLDDVEPEIGTPEAEMRQTCMDEANRLMGQKIELLRSADELNVSPDLKAYWKERVLADKTLNNPNEFRNAVEVASRVSEKKIAGIEELFLSGKPDVDTAYAAMQSLSLSVDMALSEVHNWNALDGDEKGLARFHALKALLDRMPAFRSVFESDEALVEAMYQRAGDDMASMDERLELTAEVSIYFVQALRTKSVDNALLAASLGDLNKMPVPFLAALNHAEAAVRANFAGRELPADLLRFVPGNGLTLGETLRYTVAKAGPLSPAQFAELAQRSMTHAIFKADARKAAVDHAVQSLAARVGVSVEAMARTLNIAKLSASFSYLEFGPDATAESVRQAYMEKAESFLQTKFALLDSVDALDVSEDLKAFWKNDVLTVATLDSSDILSNAVEAASKVSKSKIEGVEALFSNGMPDADTVYAALLSLSIELHDAQVGVYGFDGFRNLGGDGQGEARFHASKALLSQMPNLQAVLEKEPALLDKLHDRAGEDLRSNDEVRHYGGVQADYLMIAIQTKSVDNAKLASSLSQLDTMPVPFLAALNKAEAAVRANFADMGLPADLLSYRPGIGSTLGDTLRNAVAQAEAPLTPAQFGELAQSTMNNALASAVLLPRVRELAAEGQPLQQFQDVWVARAVIRRHPELSEAFATGDAATVRAALGKLEGEVPALVRLRQDMNAAWAAGEAHLFNRLAETIGMDEQELRSTLNLTGVTTGGSFDYKQADILKEMEKPGGVIPSREELMAGYEAIAQKFVNRKSELYQSIDSFGLPAEAAAELKKSVLTNSVLKMPDFLTRCSDAAKFIAAEPLRDMLRGPVTKEAVLEMLNQMAGHYGAATHHFFPQDILNDMGSDETSALQRYTLQIFFARNPDLKGALPREIAADVDDAASEEVTRMVSLSGGSYNLPPEERTAFMQQYENAIMTYAFVTNMMPQD